MNILITGAYGFVGTNLINNLKIKHNLYGLDKFVRQEKEY
jgi:nucleoside-diphosphate-sugar epimerase